VIQHIYRPGERDMKEITPSTFWQGQLRYRQEGNIELKRAEDPVKLVQKGRTWRAFDHFVGVGK
jgi:hypothetical protein